MSIYCNPEPRRRRCAVIVWLAGLFACATLGAATLAAESPDDWIAGKVLFRRLWVPAPTRTDAADGLGPLFNARSCGSCHPGGGPSQTRTGSDGQTDINGAVVRLSDDQGRPHPWYGKQLQTQAVPGLTPEATIRRLVEPGDGSATTEIHLLGPQLEPGYRMGVRIAPSLRASGRIEAVAEAAIRERGASDVQRRLGLAGRARILDSGEGPKVGRYGWKASQPDLTQQVAEAFAIDLGLSSPHRPQPFGDCTPQQTACRALPTGESAAFEGRELSNLMLTVVAAYVAALDSTQAGPDTNGERIFAATGCAGCHIPRMPASGGGEVEVFSDLLLHDLGAHLDDGVAEPGVRSSEWRTAPLVDLAARGGRRRYLHDGRAASVADAVEWHGGEAASSRSAFDALTADERHALIRYLEAR